MLGLKVEELKEIKRVVWFGLCFGVAEIVILMHEIVHQAIFKYNGIESTIRLGILYGETIPNKAYFLEPQIKAIMWQAHSINEITLPIIFILLLILYIQLYRLMIK